MKRITSAKIRGEPLDTARTYKLVTRGYMGRGKDGYDALLVKSEGGEAEEVVSEENGVLISTILRQYFMSLKVLGRWKAWSGSLNRCFERVNAEVHGKHPVMEPPGKTNGVKAGRPGLHKYPTRMDAHDTPFDEEEDEKVEGHQLDPVGAHGEDERQLEIMRRVMRKWWRLTGLPGHPGLCDSVSECDFMVNWTKVSALSECHCLCMMNANVPQAIAPRLEGRIKIVES
jgi:hypothetical protein